MPTSSSARKMTATDVAAFPGKLVAALAKHANRRVFPTPAGTLLYHATRTSSLDAIRTGGGLVPLAGRSHPCAGALSADWDASKAGLVSMSTTVAGAGAMGGTSTLLRTTSTGVGGPVWRSVYGTEVRTTSTIPASDLEMKVGAAWVPLVPVA